MSIIKQKYGICLHVSTIEVSIWKNDLKVKIMMND